MRKHIHNHPSQVRNPLGQIYVMVVISKKINGFEQYIAIDNQKVLEWLDERPLEGK
mgnify:CR=1 FL=1